MCIVLNIPLNLLCVCPPNHTLVVFDLMANMIRKVEILVALKNKNEILNSKFSIDFDLR